MKSNNNTGSYHQRAQQFIQSAHSKGYNVKAEDGELIASRKKKAKKGLKMKPQGKGVPSNNSPKKKIGTHLLGKAMKKLNK